MFDKVYFLGDIHGRVPRSIKNLQKTAEANNEHYAVILLGDVGTNYYGDERDNVLKDDLAKRKNLTFYCLRGNHEMRPKDYNIPIVLNEDVIQDVYQEEEYPTINYLIDGKMYDFNGYEVLAIGGAYSVDKFYRLSNGWSWFANEQLTTKEMEAIFEYWKDDGYVDIVISHTCPFEWQPTDLFLPEINQSTVDNTMEVWMEELANAVQWNIWLWGHYHADRIEAPHCEMFYYEVEDLESIEARWKKYDETGELDWWLPVSPSMSKIVNK